MPTKIGIAKRLCRAPERLGSALAGALVSASSLPGEGGGKPPTGSVTNTPEPIRPTPAAPTSSGARRDPDDPPWAPCKTRYGDDVQRAGKDEVYTLKPTELSVRQRTHGVTSPIVPSPPCPDRRKRANEEGSRDRPQSEPKRYGTKTLLGHRHQAMLPTTSSS